MPSRNASGASVDGEPPSKRSSTEHSSSCSTAAGDLKKVGLWPSNRWAYFALSACFLLMFNCWGMINAYGTFASYYDQQLMPKTSKLLLNLIGSTQSALVLSLSLPIGRLLDAGKSSYIIALGTVLQAIGLFGLSAVNGDGNMGQSNYALIWFTQGLIQGLGMSCFFVTSSWVAASWFKETKSLALGIVATGASIAGFVYPMMLRFLIARLGFNNAVRCVAAVAVGTSILAWVFARPNPQQEIRTPEKWLATDTWIDKSAFRNPTFLCKTAAIFFLFLGFYPVFFNLEEWASSTGVGYRTPVGGQQPWRNQGALATYELLSIMNASSTIGRVLSAYLSIRHKALRVHAIVTFVSALLLLILWPLASNPASAIAFVVVFGAFSGAVIGLPAAAMAEILGEDEKAQAKLGHWVGMMYCFAGLPALVGPLIAGYLISRYDTFITVQCWSGSCFLISAGFMVAAAILRRPKGTRVRDEGKVDLELETSQPQA